MFFLLAQEVIPVSAPMPGSGSGSIVSDWMPTILSLIATAVAGWFARRSVILEKQHEQKLANQQRAHEQKLANQTRTLELQMKKLELEASTRKEEDQQRRDWINGVLEDSRTNREKVLTCEHEIRLLTGQVASLKAELTFYRQNAVALDAQDVLQHVMEFFEAPAWLHAVGELKWYVNDHFCDYFNVQRRNFWSAINLITLSDEATGSQIIAQDLEIVDSGSMIETVEERCKYLGDPNNDTRVRVKLRKTPVRIGEKNYVLGQVLHYPPETNGQIIQN